MKTTRTADTIPQRNAETNAGSVKKQLFSTEETSSQKCHPVKNNQTDLSGKASTFHRGKNKLKGHKPNTPHKNLDPKH